MGILFNEVSRTDLRDGDHVYSWRTAYSYAHHGIFVGDDDVVHFTRGSGQELGGPLGAGTSLINSVASSSLPKQNLSCQRFPDSCGLENGNSGVIRSCLDCFLEGGPVHRFEYDVSKVVFLAQVRGGTCTLAQSDPPDVVIHRAKYLHKNGFGNYDLFSNNCEDFAIYCKTGYIVKKNASGRSGQVAAMDGVHSASRLAYDNRDMLNSSPGLAALMLIGNYLFKRYTADIGVRVDKIKVAVEGLALYLDSTTGIRVEKTKKPVEDSAVYHASSTGMRVDKTKVRVEDVAVFLDSHTGKKLPVEDMAAYLDFSTGTRVDKTKLPVEDSAVYLGSSTGIRVDKTKVPVEDVAVVLDSSTGRKSPVEDVAVVLDSSTGQNPLVAESSTFDQAISRNRNSKKKKKKLLQQHRRNCELVHSVEDVAVLLDSSTGKKPQVEDLAVYFDSSTGIGVEKTTVPVEDVTVFLDSSTGKKPLLEDLAANVDSSTGIGVDNSESDQAIRRNRSSKKQKKKLRQKQRRNCQLVEGPIPSGLILQEN